MNIVKSMHLPHADRSLITPDDDLPVISPNGLRQLHDVGGQFCGFIEDGLGRRFEDIWVEYRVVYDKQRKGLVCLWVCTRSAGSGDRHAPAAVPADVTRYCTVATRKELESGNVIDGIEIVHVYENRHPSLSEMSSWAETSHTVFTTAAAREGIEFITGAVNAETGHLGVQGRVVG